MGVRGPGAVPINARKRTPPLRRLPLPPKALSPDAARAWRECGRRAVRLGTIAEADLVALELLARTLGSVAELEQVLRTDGLIVESGAAKKAHPAIAALGQSRAQARALLMDFGLVPTGREKLRGAIPDMVDDPIARKYLFDPRRPKPWQP